MRTKILFIWALVASLTAWYFWLETENLQHQVDSLKWSLNYQINQTNDLIKMKNELEEKIRELKNENAKLSLQIELLKNKRESEIQELRSNISDLKAYVEYLENKLKLYEQVPHGYYSTNFFPDNDPTLNNLKNFLSTLKIHRYERGIFDCSEISAYVEWALEDAGFDTYICLGDDHAWNMVKVEGATYYVDASSGTPVITKKPPEKIVKTFKNIYDAVDYFGSVEQWDWWNVIGFPPS